MSAEFTKGPWFVERRRFCSVVRQSAVRDSYSSRVAECPQWDPAPKNQPDADTALANANLIAAAPELYAIVARMNREGGHGIANHEAMESALAKARGDTSDG